MERNEKDILLLREGEEYNTIKKEEIRRETRKSLRASWLYYTQTSISLDPAWILLRNAVFNKPLLCGFTPVTNKIKLRNNYYGVAYRSPIHHLRRILSGYKYPVEAVDSLDFLLYPNFYAKGSLIPGESESFSTSAPVLNELEKETVHKYITSKQKPEKNICLYPFGYNYNFGWMCLDEALQHLAIMRRIIRCRIREDKHLSKHFSEDLYL